jgi:hypothetical protein
MVAAIAFVAAGAMLAGSPIGAGAAPDPMTCTGQPPGSAPPKQPGPVRWGINPRVQVGQIGPIPSAALAEDPSKQLANLDVLSGGRPFVLRLNRIFWPDPAGQLARLDSDVAVYTAAGYMVELQMRYHPSAGETATSPDDFAAWAADLAHRYDGNPRVVSAQVTNEANLGLSADSSDGGYTFVKDALIRGVEAVHARVVSDGAAARFKVGFNWFYRGDPTSEKNFWTYLRDNGGPTFVAALDWVGLDAYPGTVFLPLEPPGGYYNGMVNAMSTLHDCLMAYAGIDKPIYIEETGFITEGPDPSIKGPAVQLQALQELTGAVRDYAGRYRVTDFRWFDLRDADSGSPNPQQHYGLLYSDYSPKPAFCAYAVVVTGTCRMAARGPRSPAVSDGGGLPKTDRAAGGAVVPFLLAAALMVGCAGRQTNRHQRGRRR